MNIYHLQHLKIDINKQGVKVNDIELIAIIPNFTLVDMENRFTWLIFILYTYFTKENDIPI